MSEYLLLSDWILSKAEAWTAAVGDKTIDELGGADVAVITVMNEMTVNIWPAMYETAMLIEDIILALNDHIINSEANFKVVTTVVNDLMEVMDKRDAALTERVNKSLQTLNKQMTNQNKVLDKQVIKLSKSISKITGGNS